MLKIKADLVETSALFLLNPIKVTLTRTTLESTTARKLRDRENRLASSLKRFSTSFGRWILQQPLTQRRLCLGFVNFLEASDDPLRIYYETRVCPNEQQSAFRIRVALYTGSCIPKRIARYSFSLRVHKNNLSLYNRVVASPREICTVICETQYLLVLVIDYA